MSRESASANPRSIPEMAGGWGSELMQRENEFLVLDGAYVSLYHFGYWLTHTE